VLDLNPPTYDEIDAELDAVLERVPVRLSHGGRDALVKACQGLMMSRIRLGLARAVASYGRLDERAIPLMLEEKKQRIRRTEVLEFWPATETVDDIGGLDILKLWLEQRAAAFTAEARSRWRGLPDRRQVELRAEGCLPQVHRGERRRVRARHLQRPPDHGKQPASAYRGRADRGVCYPGGADLHLYSRRVLGHRRPPCPEDRGGTGAGLRRAEHLRLRLELRDLHAPGRRGVHLR